MSTCFPRVDKTKPWGELNEENRFGVRLHLGARIACRVRSESSTQRQRPVNGQRRARHIARHYEGRRYEERRHAARHHRYQHHAFAAR
jgi:hypothetical protein